MGRSSWSFDRCFSAGRKSLNLVLLLLALNFVGGCRLKLMYISLTVNIRLILTHLHSFQLLWLLSQIIEIICTSTLNLLHLKWSSDRLIIVVKKFLNLPNLLMLIMLIKQKNLSLPRSLLLATFGELLLLFSIKVMLLYLLYLTDLRLCLQLLIKQKCLQNAFLRAQILIFHVSLYLLFLLGLIWKCIIFM